MALNMISKKIHGSQYAQRMYTAPGKHPMIPALSVVCPNKMQPQKNPIQQVWQSSQHPNRPDSQCLGVCVGSCGDGVFQTLPGWCAGMAAGCGGGGMTGAGPWKCSGLSHVTSASDMVPPGG